MVYKIARISVIGSAVLIFGAMSLQAANSQTQTRSPKAVAPAQAAAPSAPAAPIPAPAAPGGPSVAAPATAQVDGFRSAKFGMSDVQVKDAITKDFGIKLDAISEQPNPAERTTVLSIKVPDLLQGGGVADVAYVLGYESKKLIQVSVSWSKATDEKMTPEQLFSNSSVLRAHFLTEGFKPDTIASNMPIGNGLLVFRGSDDKDHTAMLILQGTFSEGQATNQKILTPAALLLFYVQDAKAPDVYRLPAGSF
jgi:hypothetical protein